MIAVDKALRLQAWVDGELNPREARDVEVWVKSDLEAQAFVEDLRRVNAVMVDSEVERAVPETREFYWSGIAHSIERFERASKREQPSPGDRSGVAWWWRWVVPVGAVALIALSLPLLRHGPQSDNSLALAVGHEVDTPIAGVNAFTFRSESERMTVVWVDFNSD